MELRTRARMLRALPRESWAVLRRVSKVTVLISLVTVRVPRLELYCARTPKLIPVIWAESMI